MVPYFLLYLFSTFLNSSNRKPLSMFLLVINICKFVFYVSVAKYIRWSNEIIGHYWWRQRILNLHFVVTEPMAGYWNAITPILHLEATNKHRGVLCVTTVDVLSKVKEHFLFCRAAVNICVTNKQFISKLHEITEKRKLKLDTVVP